ncbi:GDP-mannose 4,6-dehydratase [bacterium]|nr:GDP-mannose 4,6-dehydratase [bacterium]
MRVAFITGITGQDGSYLAELLLAKEYKVYGMIRRMSLINTTRIDPILDRLHLRYGDVSDTSNLVGILTEIRDGNAGMERLEVYNLAAQSHVKVSFEMPEFTGNVDGLGVLRILEAIRICGLIGITRFYQASTSELYGLVQSRPQNEDTPFYPRSPYGVAKLYGYWITRNYREAYGMYACTGVLFNHESPRRGENFVTRKITLGLGKILRGEADELLLGNLDAMRDWGHARDFVVGMWLMLQADTPTDYVLATGEEHSVREFVETAFQKRGFHVVWQGEGVDEVGIDAATGRILIRVHPRYFRPSEVETLLGDASRARRELDWKPQTSFDELVREMVDADA